MGRLLAKLGSFGHGLSDWALRQMVSLRCAHSWEVADMMFLGGQRVSTLFECPKCGAFRSEEVERKGLS